MSAHPILSLRRPTELFQHLTTLGYQAECDAVDDMPVAHTEALSQLIHERIEALEVRGNGLLWQRVRIVEAMDRGFEVLDEAANRGDDETVAFCLEGLQSHQDRVDAIDRELWSIGPVHGPERIGPTRRV